MRKQGLWMDRLKKIASENNLTLNKERIIKLSSVSNVCLSSQNLKFWDDTPTVNGRTAWDTLIEELITK